MFLAPVIERELRVEARKPGVYYARLWWGLAAIAALWAMGTASRGESTGERLFQTIHSSLIAMVALLAPVISAESISRERREGTLGLLFLTPLTARQIIVGKFNSRVVRLFYFLLMFIPFLLLPVMAGGVAIRYFLISLVLLFAIMVTGIAVGMIASAISIQIGAAVFRALFFSAIAFVAITSLTINIATIGNPFHEPAIIRALLFGPFFMFFPGQILDTFTNAYIPWVTSFALIVFSAILVRGAISFCTAKITRFAEAEIQTVRQAALRRRFLTPIVWKTRFRRSMQRRLSANPFLWLEYREAWSRVARSFVVLAVVAVETLLVCYDPDFNTFLQAQFYMLIALVGAITLKATTSFQYEKESGAVELILVSPITERKLVSGRLDAVFSYYLPIFVSLGFFTLCGIFFLRVPTNSFNDPSPLAVTNLCLCLVSVPAAGLFFALYCKSFLPALVGTILAGIFGAWFLFFSFTNVLWYVGRRLNIGWADTLEMVLTSAPWIVFALFVAYHLALIFLCRHLALKLLERRAFAYQKTA